MSSYKMLFNYLKTLFPSKYRVTFGTQEENKEQTVGIFFQGGTPRKRIINRGEYLCNTVSVTFNVNSKKDYNAVEMCIKELEDIRGQLNTLHDFEYTSDNKKINVLYTELFGDINMLGLNSVGIPCFSLNYIIYYK